MPIANFSNLMGPDLIVIVLIIAVLAIPFAIAIPIVFLIDRQRKKPPPLSTRPESTSKIKIFYAVIIDVIASIT
jgi:hypothetical protein